LKKIIFN